MKNKDNNISSGVGSGFLLGFILGILATLLLTTKKGREILKELLDKGIQRIIDFEESLGETKQKIQPEEENDYIKPESEEIKKEIHHLIAVSSHEKILNEEKVKDNGKHGITNYSSVMNKSAPHTAVRRLFFRKTQNKIL